MSYGSQAFDDGFAAGEEASAQTIAELKKLLERARGAVAWSSDQTGLLADIDAALEKKERG